MGMGGARGVVGVGENRGVEYKKTLLVRGSLLSVSVDNPLHILYPLDHTHFTHSSFFHVIFLFSMH